jgi:nitrite reductase (NADH) large subunit
VVIGGGLLGLEAAWGLARRGMAVTVLHLMPTLMERQLDDAAGAMLERDLVRRGLAVMTPAQTEAILGEHHVEAVQLADGRILPADLVVLAIGVRPEIALARDAGLKVGRGVMVFDDMRTSDPAILAVGECAEHRGQAHGLVAPLWEQARVAAATLAGEAAAYAPPAFATSLKITGIDLYSAGVLAAADTDDEEVVLRDEARGHYRKLVLRQGRLIGAVLYGDVGEGPWFLRLIESGEPIGGRRHALVFGQALAEAA